MRRVLRSLPPFREPKDTMISPISPLLPWLRIAQLVGVSLLVGACTVEHMEIGVDRPALGENSTSDPDSASGRSDGTEPGSSSDVNSNPAPDCNCEIPAICRLCDDGSCAEPRTTCNADGSCTLLDWECRSGSTEPSNPGPSEKCPEECPVDDVCVTCGDGCAKPIVSCNADGTCGAVTYQCDEPNEPDCDCPVDAICHLCSDDSCARPKTQCKPDGKCGETIWLCPEDEGHDCDVSNVACDLAIDCKEGTVPTRNGGCYGPCVPPSQCAPAPVFDCDLSNLTCKRAEPDCGEDMVPTHVNGCYGECVPPALCKKPLKCPVEGPIPREGKECADQGPNSASPEVLCNDDGSCGEVIWHCD
jgi:hypothetical protein